MVSVLGMPSIRSRPLISMVTGSSMRKRASDLELHLLGGALAHEEVVLLLDVLDDRLVHLVAGHPDGLRVDDAGQRDDRDVGGAALRYR